MPSNATLAAGLPFNELDFPQNSAALIASNLQNSPTPSSRRRKQRLWDSLTRKSRAVSNRLSDIALFVHSRECPASSFRVADLWQLVDLAKCMMRDEFLEGTDGDGTANDFLISSDCHYEKEEIPVLWNLIHDIEPMNVSRVGQDVSTESKDAMKRTISGMLGLLPSDQFDITVKASRESSTKLLISSIMTGYTLRNAEYRVALQKSFELAEDESKLQCDDGGIEICFGEKSQRLGECNEQINCDASLNLLEKIPAEANETIDSLHTSSPVVANYINHLKSRLSSVTKELQDCKRKISPIAVNKAAEDKNGLLDYLRSLDTEKVSELSQPSSLDVEEMIKQVVSRCLQAMAVANSPLSTIHGDFKVFEDGRDIDDMQRISSIAAPRDYLARLLFWCMLFGHHLRSTEYRLELNHSLSLC